MRCVMARQQAGRSGLVGTCLVGKTRAEALEVTGWRPGASVRGCRCCRRAATLRFPLFRCDVVCAVCCAQTGLPPGIHQIPGGLLSGAAIMPHRYFALAVKGIARGLEECGEEEVLFHKDFPRRPPLFLTFSHGAWPGGWGRRRGDLRARDAGGSGRAFRRARQGRRCARIRPDPR